MFYLNNFASKNIHIVDEGSNAFDNGIVGNYWSNYNSSDSNSDGIGDTPYKIDRNSYDHFPLMNPVFTPHNLDDPYFIKVSWAPTSPRSDESVTVFVNVFDDDGVDSVILSYFHNGWFNVSMVYDDETGLWNGTIPSFPSGEVRFKVYAFDTHSNLCVSEEYIYTIAPNPQTTNWAHLYIGLATLAAISTTILILKKRKKFS